MIGPRAGRAACLIRAPRRNCRLAGAPASNVGRRAIRGLDQAGYQRKIGFKMTGDGSTNAGGRHGTDSEREHCRRHRRHYWLGRFRRCVRNSANTADTWRLGCRNHPVLRRASHRDSDCCVSFCRHGTRVRGVDWRPCPEIAGRGRRSRLAVPDLYHWRSRHSGSRCMCLIDAHGAVRQGMEPGSRNSADALRYR